MSTENHHTKLFPAATMGAQISFLFYHEKTLQEHQTFLTVSKYQDILTPLKSMGGQSQSHFSDHFFYKKNPQISHPSRD